MIEESVKKLKKLKKNPTDDEKLMLYGLFKQHKVGDCNISKPGYFNFKGMLKYDAWNKNRSMSKETAAVKYNEYVTKLAEKYGLKK